MNYIASLILKLFFKEAPKPVIIMSDDYQKGYEQAKKDLEDEVAENDFYLKGYNACDLDLRIVYHEAIRDISKRLSKEYGAEINTISEHESGEDMITGIPTRTVRTKFYPTKEYQVRSELKEFNKFKNR